MEESGALEAIQGRRIPKGGNIVVGRVSLDYDDRFDTPGIKFRMALMIYTDDGKKITDFFDGIPTEGGDMVGDGNAKLPVPWISPSRVRNSTSIRQAAETFPEIVDKDFTLTFKEFTGHAYYLQDAPSGTAFVWFQTGFDGNRVLQIPAIAELNPTKGTINRLDFTVGKMDSFHTL